MFDQGQKCRGRFRRNIGRFVDRRQDRILGGLHRLPLSVIGELSAPRPHKQPKSDVSKEGEGALRANFDSFHNGIGSGYLP